jgi:hypothetical protein
MDDAMSTVLQQLTNAIEHMESTRKTASAQEEDRSSRLAGRTQELVGSMSGQVETLLELLEEQVTLTKANLEAISTVATRAIDGMNAGALNMGAAAQRFETAGNAVSGVFDRSAKVSEQLTASATSLQAAALAVRQGFDQYDSARKTVENHVAALNTLIETARKEAGLSKAMITDLDRIVAQLRLAESQSREYLEGVNKALESAFEAFGTQLTGAIRKTISETDRHLSDGTQQLNGVVQQIGVALARLKRA